MLTRTQIQRLAQRNHVGMQAQERDYLQHLLLMLLYSRSQALIFKGGTALRLVYRGGRYSEDLDFSVLASGASVGACRISPAAQVSMTAATGRRSDRGIGGA